LLEPKLHNILSVGVYCIQCVGLMSLLTRVTSRSKYKQYAQLLYTGLKQCKHVSMSTRAGARCSGIAHSFHQTLSTHAAILFTKINYSSFC